MSLISCDAPAARPGLARQNEKGSLESVLGVSRLVQHAAADGEVRRTVPAHQLGKRLFLAPLGEVLKQFAVLLLLCAVPRQHRANVAKNSLCLPCGHNRHSPEFRATV